VDHRATAGDKSRRWHGFFNELLHLSDRVIGLLAPIILDERLKGAIQAKWFNRKTRSGMLLEDLFRDGGELGNLGTRARIGFAIGLFTPETLDDLLTIIKIRNRFAHSLEVKDFNGSPISDLVKNLKIIDRYPPPERVRLDEVTQLGPDDIFGHVIKYSGSSDLTTPRGRFIRSIEILASLLHREEAVATRGPEPRF
jgi:hypothetical protein